MGDLLYNAACEYKKLENVSYEIFLGRKGQLYKLLLHFPYDAFYHLIGLQHLQDITYSSTNKERIFKDILRGKLKYEVIRKSIFFEENYIEERISNLPLLEMMLDSNRLTYLINGKEYKKYTRIQADYLFEYKGEELDIFYFFAIKDKLPKYKGCSFFKKHNMDYTAGTSRTTVLKIVKTIDNGNGNVVKEELYKNSSYKEG